MPSTLVDPRSHGIAVNTEQVRSHRVGDASFSVPATCWPGIERMTSVAQATSTASLTGTEDDSWLLQLFPTR